MKTLYLLRHAKSDWVSPDQQDFDRPLNARGRQAARAMGHELRRLGLAADHILASPAARVAETLEMLADGYGGRMPVVRDDKLYLASTETLLEAVRATSDEHRRLLIVGHNPGLQQLALMLTAPNPLRARIAVKYPTGALAEIAFETAHWRELSLRTGAFVRFLRPRDLG